MYSPQELLKKYLQDVIAAERNFEDQLKALSKTGEQKTVQELFSSFAFGAKRQHRLLTARLEALGGRPSAAKGFLAHLLSFSPMTGQVGQKPQEKSTQNLIMVYGAAAAEMAMYEALASAASAAGDQETEQLARQMQAMEQSDRDRVWNLLNQSAIEAFEASSMQARGAA